MKTLFLFLLFLSSNAQAWELGSIGLFKFEQITKNVYVMHGPLALPSKANTGFMNNPAIIVSHKGIILIDPGSTYQVGKHILKEIEKISKLPILAVFNTHIHGDHWLANQAIKEKYPSVNIYASPKMISQVNAQQGSYWINLMARLTEGLSSDTKIVAPTIALKNGDELVIDGQLFTLYLSAKAHTDTDVMIYHENSKTLFLGDNALAFRLGQFDSSSNISGNIAALALAKTLNADYFVPGHGPSGSFKEAVLPYFNYLIALKKAVKSGYNEDLEDFEIKEKIISQFSNYKNWSGFNENFGKHINKLYLEIETAEF